MTVVYIDIMDSNTIIVLFGTAMQCVTNVNKTKLCPLVFLGKYIFGNFWELLIGNRYKGRYKSNTKSKAQRKADYLMAN